ncbi:MAG: hypothetical protein PHR28_14905 [candidate division Zixibacteria bacterium]|nr:hypothetical protein [candidate division Zixibacteria bacterium]
MMKRQWLRHASLTGLIGLILLSVGVSADETAAIIRTGTFHGNEVTIDCEPGWFGLFRVDSTFELVPVNVAVTRTYDPIIGDSTGKRVAIDRPGEPLVLITGVERLETGPVTTLYYGDQFVNLGQEFSILPEGRYCYSLSAVGEARLRDGLGEMLLHRYALIFRHVDTTQILIEYPILALDGLPTLLWAGDLDRDGRLDLIMNLTNHYNVDLYALFLSSKADPGNLVKKVAEFRIVGC